MSCEVEEESSMDEDDDMPGLESVSSSEVKSAPYYTSCRVPQLNRRREYVRARIQRYGRCTTCVCRTTWPYTVGVAMCACRLQLLTVFYQQLTLHNFEYACSCYYTVRLL